MSEPLTSRFPPRRSAPVFSPQQKKKKKVSLVFHYFLLYLLPRRGGGEIIFFSRISIYANLTPNPPPTNGCNGRERGDAQRGSWLLRAAPPRRSARLRSDGRNDFCRSVPSPLLDVAFHPPGGWCVGHVAPLCSISIGLGPGVGESGAADALHPLAPHVSALRRPSFLTAV